MEIFVVGHVIGVCEDKTAWDVLGVFSCKNRAEAACYDPRCFVGPLTLDQELPREILDWPGCYFPSEFIKMPKRLTAENGAKAALIGEFTVDHTEICGDCSGDGCEECDNTGERTEKIPISWTTIKEIYDKAVSLFQ